MRAMAAACALVSWLMIASAVITEAGEEARMCSPVDGEAIRIDGESLTFCVGPALKRDVLVSRNLTVVGSSSLDELGSSLSAGGVIQCRSTMSNNRSECMDNCAIQNPKAGGPTCGGSSQYCAITYGGSAVDPPASEFVAFGDSIESVSSIINWPVRAADLHNLTLDNRAVSGSLLYQIYDAIAKYTKPAIRTRRLMMSGGTNDVVRNPNWAISVDGLWIARKSLAAFILASHVTGSLVGGEGVTFPGDPAWPGNRGDWTFNDFYSVNLGYPVERSGVLTDNLDSSQISWSVTGRYIGVTFLNNVGSSRIVTIMVDGVECLREPISVTTNFQTYDRTNYNLYPRISFGCDRGKSRSGVRTTMYVTVLNSPNPKRTFIDNLFSYEKSLGVFMALTPVLDDGGARLLERSNVEMAASYQTLLFNNSGFVVLDARKHASFANTVNYNDWLHPNDVGSIIIANMLNAPQSKWPASEYGRLASDAPTSVGDTESNVYGDASMGCTPTNTALCICDVVQLQGNKSYVLSDKSTTTSFEIVKVGIQPVSLGSPIAHFPKSMNQMFPELEQKAGAARRLLSNLQTRFSVRITDTSIIFFRDMSMDTCGSTCLKQEYVSAVCCLSEECTNTVELKRQSTEIVMSKTMKESSGMMKISIMDAGNYEIFSDSLPKVGISTCDVPDCFLCARAFQTYDCASPTFKVALNLLIVVCSIAAAWFMYWTIVHAVFLTKTFLNLLSCLMCCSCCFKVRAWAAESTSKVTYVLIKNYKESVLNDTSGKDDASSFEDLSNVRVVKPHKFSLSKTAVGTIATIMCISSLTEVNGFGPGLVNPLYDPARMPDAIDQIYMDRARLAVSENVMSKSCDNGLFIPVKYGLCRGSNCSVEFDTTASLPTAGVSVCFDVGSDKVEKMSGRLLVSVTATKQVQTYTPVYQTFDWSPIYASHHFCGHSGPCGGDGGSAGPNDDPSGIFTDTNPLLMSNPGRTSYHDTCGCAGCGCFYCSSSCTFTRWALDVTGSSPLYVFKKTDVGPSTSVMVSIDFVSGPGQYTNLHTGALEMGVRKKAGKFEVLVAGALEDFVQKREFPEYIVSRSKCDTGACSNFEARHFDSNLVSALNSPTRSKIGDIQAKIASSLTLSDYNFDPSVVSCDVSKYDTCSAVKSGASLFSSGVKFPDSDLSLKPGVAGIEAVLSYKGAIKPLIISARTTEPVVFTSTESAVCPSSSGIAEWSGFYGLGSKRCSVRFQAWSDCEEGVASLSVDVSGVHLFKSALMLSVKGDSDSWLVEGECSEETIPAGDIRICSSSGCATVSYSASSLIKDDEFIEGSQAFAKASLLSNDAVEGGASWDTPTLGADRLPALLSFLASMLGGSSLWVAIVSILFYGALVVLGVIFAPVLIKKIGSLMRKKKQTEEEQRTSLKEKESKSPEVIEPLLPILPIKSAPKISLSKPNHRSIYSSNPEF